MFTANENDQEKEKKWGQKEKKKNCNDGKRKMNRKYKEFTSKVDVKSLHNWESTIKVLYISSFAFCVML